MLVRLRKCPRSDRALRARTRTIDTPGDGSLGYQGLPWSARRARNSTRLRCPGTRPGDARRRIPYFYQWIDQIFDAYDSDVGCRRIDYRCKTDRRSAEPAEYQCCRL